MRRNSHRRDMVREQAATDDEIKVHAVNCPKRRNGVQAESSQRKWAAAG
jgi:hypothetical protein